MTTIPDFLLPAVCCHECGACFVRTISGFWACPYMHGKLMTRDVMDEKIIAVLKENPSCRFTCSSVLRRLEALENGRISHEQNNQKAKRFALRTPQMFQTTIDST